MFSHRIVVFVCCLSFAVAGKSHGKTYHISTLGNDANPGSEALPCKTIQYVADQMMSGDTCIIHAGVYRECIRPARSGTADKPIAFMSAEDGKVVVSGADAIQGAWVEHDREILKMKLTSDHVPQVLAAGQMMPQCRWPNVKTKDLMDVERARSGLGTDYDGIVVHELPSSDVVGATIQIWPGHGWDNATRIISKVTGNRLEFDRDFRPKKQDELHGFDPFQPTEDNPFVLYDSLALLDAPGEWFFDKATKTLYWMPISGIKTDDLEIRTRWHGFDLKGLSDIQIAGIDLVGCGFDMRDSQRCVIRHCTCIYADHLVPLDIYNNPVSTNIVTGQANRIECCTFAFAGLCALRIAGENNTVADSVIHTSNYLGAHIGCIQADDSKGLTIEYCTISGSGRELVHFMGATKLTIDHCDLSGCNRLSNDTGALKCWGTDGQGSVIAYNWVHDNHGKNSVGIYLDNFSKNFVIHHNVVWNNTDAGIRLNSSSNNNDVFHNTILDNGKALAVFTYRDHVPDQSGTRIINNLYNGELQVVQGDKAPEVRSNIPVNTGDYVPPSESNSVNSTEYPGRDQAVVIDGFPVETIRKGPDVGAYEIGKPFWKPGPRKQPRSLLIANE